MDDPRDQGGKPPKRRGPWRTPRLALALLCLMLPAALPARAQTTPNLVVEVTVEGNRMVEPGQVLAGIASRVNAPLNRDLVARDIHTLFASGFFTDVRAEVEEIPGSGYRLVFVVKERPRIGALSIVGNTLITTKTLQEALTAKVGGVFSQPELDGNVEKIRRAYREKGYFKVKLSTQVERVSDLRYTVKIVIEETPRIYITEIHVRGSKVFSELQIKRFMQSGEVDCFDWITSTGVFDEDRINADMQTITSEYLKLGYIRVFIDRPQVTLIRNAEFSRIRVEMEVSEGAQYFVGTVDAAGDILGDKKDITDLIGLHTGNPYNPFIQNQDQFRIGEVYQEQGYAFAQVIPDRRIDDKALTVDVTYQIHKGEKAYIGRIEFQGNRETRDFVMRREFDVREHELYNGRKLRESQTNLRILGYFKPSMDVSPRPTELSNEVDIITSVEETQTGTLQGQLGYSDFSGVTGGLSVSKGNLGGRGQTVRVSTEFAEKNVRSSVVLSFLEPHLLDTDYSSESSASYYNRQDLTELQRGLMAETSVAQGFGYLFFRRLRLSFTLDATNRDFDNKLYNPLQLRSATTALNYRSLNSQIFPTDGSLITLAATQVGGQVLQGSTEYRRYRLTLQRFIAVNDSNTVVVMGRVRLGWLESVGANRIPVEDRFRLGGIATLRGYNFFEVGGPYGDLERLLNSDSIVVLDDAGNPVVNASGQVVRRSVDRRLRGLSEAQLDQIRGGGIQERLLNLELIFPLAGETLRGVVFYDAGNVNAEPTQYQLLNTPEPNFLDLLQSYGGGMRLISPLGVLRFEYGIKAAPRKGESPDKFDFTISTLF
jgi:outer membrane protein insertion porin family